MNNTLLLAHHMSGDPKYLQPLRWMAAIRLKYLKRPPEETPAPGSEAWCAEKLGLLAPTLAKYKALSGSDEFDELLARDQRASAVSAGDPHRTALVAALRNSAEALRVNFPGYTSEVRYTDRVLRFPVLFSRNMMFAEPIRSIKTPNPALLYSLVTGDPGDCGYFPMNAVRWLTPPRNIAAIVTQSGTDRFGAELFNFGPDRRSMAAELYLLSQGRYTLTLSTASKGADAPLTILRRQFSVTGPVAKIALELPSRTLCILQVSSVEPP